MIWVSTELRALLGTDDDAELGIASHLIEAEMRPAWRRAISDETELRQIRLQVPMMLGPDGRGAAKLRELLPEAVHDWLDELQPEPVPDAVASEIEFLQGDLPPVTVQVLDLRLGAESDHAGVLRLYGSALPARVLALVARGDEGMFERMTRVFEPGERNGAILFADLEASGELAPALSRGSFFGLIRELTTAIDAAVVEHRGLVGKHAGDGVTAFFLEEDLGSASAAAAAALEVAAAIGRIAAEIGDRYAGELGSAKCRMNVGLHWGESLYIGQVVTGGRIEVTALGAEVNRGARLEQAAIEGQALVSRELLERLDDSDAGRLGLAADSLDFRRLSELDGVPEKALRDAGDIEVAELGPLASSAPG